MRRQQPLQLPPQEELLQMLLLFREQVYLLHMLPFLSLVVFFQPPLLLSLLLSVLVSLLLRSLKLLIQQP